jgi:hypothetical protein
MDRIETMEDSINKHVNPTGTTTLTLGNGSLEYSKAFPQGGGAYISLDGDQGVSFYTSSDLDTLIALLTKMRDEIGKK